MPFEPLTSDLPAPFLLGWPSTQAGGLPPDVLQLDDKRAQGVQVIIHKTLYDLIKSHQQLSTAPFIVARLCNTRKQAGTPANKHNLSR